MQPNPNPPMPTMHRYKWIPNSLPEPNSTGYWFCCAKESLFQFFWQDKEDGHLGEYVFGHKHQMCATLDHKVPPFMGAMLVSMARGILENAFVHYLNA